jgi:antitoxin ChpS
MLAIPPALLDLLRLRPGARVGLTVTDGRLVVEPRGRSRYTLDELLARCDCKAAASGEDREWPSDKAVGTELI